MGIQKQEFYEGAALHQLVRSCDCVQISFVAPFFVVNDRLRVYLKYSTAVRSPWSFTFMPDEQRLLATLGRAVPIVVGLICGSDGVAAVPADVLLNLASPRDVAVRVACARQHRKHFEVSGPDGVAPGKIARSEWQSLMKDYQW